MCFLSQGSAIILLEKRAWILTEYEKLILNVQGYNLVLQLKWYHSEKKNLWKDLEYNI